MTRQTGTYTGNAYNFVQLEYATKCNELALVVLLCTRS